MNIQRPMPSKLNRLQSRYCRRLATVAIMLCLFAATARAQVSDRKPKADDPAEHAYPALGSSTPRKVNVEWNRFYDHAGLGSILARIHKEFPKLTKLYSLGKSIEGRDLWRFGVSSMGAGRSASGSMPDCASSIRRRGLALASTRRGFSSARRPVGFMRARSERSVSRSAPRPSTERSPPLLEIIVAAVVVRLGRGPGHPG